MKKIIKTPISLSLERTAKIIRLITEIRSDIQYLILILAKHPDAKIVYEVRKILREERVTNHELP